MGLLPGIPVLRTKTALAARDVVVDSIGVDIDVVISGAVSGFSTANWNFTATLILTFIVTELV